MKEIIFGLLLAVTFSVRSQNFITVNLNDCWVCGAAYYDVPKDVTWIFNNTVSQKDAKYLTEKYGIQKFEINDLVWKAYHKPETAPSQLHDPEGRILCEIKHYNVWVEDQEIKNSTKSIPQIEFEEVYYFPDTTFFPGINYFAGSKEKFFVFNKNEGKMTFIDKHENQSLFKIMDEPTVWEGVYFALEGKPEFSEFFFTKYRKLNKMGIPVLNVKSIESRNGEIFIYAKFLFNHQKSDTLKTIPVLISVNSLGEINQAFPISGLSDGFSADDGAIGFVDDTLILPVYKERKNEPAYGKFVKSGKQYSFTSFVGFRLPKEGEIFPTLSNGFILVSYGEAYSLSSESSIHFDYPDDLVLVSLFQLSSTYGVFANKKAQKLFFGEFSPEGNLRECFQLPFVKSNFYLKGNSILFLDANDRILSISIN